MVGGWSGGSLGGGIGSIEDARFFLLAVGGGLWLFVGGLFLVIGIVLLNSGKRKRKRCTATVMGRVVDIVPSMGSSGTLWSPVFSYEVGGLTYVETTPYSTSRIGYAIGEPIEIRYDPLDPHEFLIVRQRASRVLAIVFTAGGGFLLAIGIAWVALFAPI